MTVPLKYKNRLKNGKWEESRNGHIETNNTDERSRLTIASSKLDEGLNEYHKLADSIFTKVTGCTITPEEDEGFELIESETIIDLCYAHCPGTSKAIAFLTLIMQTTLLSLFVGESISCGQSRSFSVEMTFLFVGLYQCYNSPNCFSSTAKQIFSLNSSKLFEGNSRLKAIGVATIFAPFMLLFHECVFLYSCFKNKAFLSIIAMGLEFTNSMLATRAVVYISNQQQDMTDVLFNFAGVLIVLEMDEVIGGMYNMELSALGEYRIPKTSPTKTTFNTIIVFTNFFVFIILCIQTRLTNNAC